MERLGKVVIVGRPNVGKSSLFNRILGRRAAVVADRDGVTRDRHYQVAEWNGIYFQLIDTGGFLSKDLDTLDQLVRNQIEKALDEADILLFLVDARSGITDLDLVFSRMVKRRNQPSLLLVNKTESKAAAMEVHGFWSLGMGNPWPVSALQGDGLADVLDEVVKALPEKPRSLDPDESIKVAVLGRPNAGKSTLVNAMIGEERVIVSEIAGTTRDAIDTEFEYKGKKIILTDTAGLRKKARVKDHVEYFANMRAIEAIRRSHVCVLLVDVTRGLETQDLRICTQIQESGKGLIIALNKWDVFPAESKTYDHLVKEILHQVPELEWVPILPVSALTGKRLPRILDEILKVKANLERILGRENVIQYFEETVAKHPPPSSSQGPVILTRCCQVMVNPPALAFETKKPDLVMESYVRYLKRQAHETFDLSGTPLRIFFRSRFHLRTDEELKQYLEWGLNQDATDEDWTLEEGEDSLKPKPKEKRPDSADGEFRAALSSSVSEKSRQVMEEEPVPDDG